MSKRSWLRVIKRFIFPEQKRNKRRRWVFPLRLKRTKDELCEELKWGPKFNNLPPPPPPHLLPLPPPPSYALPVLQCSEEAPPIFWLHHEREKGGEISAVTKIQTAYRGYLARKALRALKGFVKLQAIIRGQRVRGQAETTLRSLQAIVSIQSQVCTKRGQMAMDKYKSTQLKGLHRDILKMFTDSSDEGKTEGGLRYLLEKYVNDQILTTKDKQKSTKGLNNLSLGRRSFHTILNPGGLHITRTIPTYMAATESARAKTRSTSTPRSRSVLVNRAYSDGEYSPYKHRLSLRLSPMSSTRSEMTCGGFSKKCLSNYENKSPKA